jgi:hypothetical protein
MMFGMTLLSWADWVLFNHTGVRIWSTMMTSMLGFFRTGGAVQAPEVEAP